MSIVRNQGMAKVVITVIHGMGIRKLRWTVDVVSGHSGGVGQRLRGVGGLCGAAPERAVEPTTFVTNTSNETRGSSDFGGQTEEVFGP